MARARDLDRKALKEDAFQDTLFWLIHWVYERRTWFIAGGTAVLVAIAAGAGTHYYRQSQLRELTTRFHEAERVALQADPSQADSPQRARAAYEDFIAAYPDTALAPVAWMHVARLAWRQDEPADAREAYRAVLEHGAATTAQRDLARIGLAKLAESEGDLDASAEQYRAVADTPYEELKAFSLGRIAAARDQPEEARQYFEKVARAAQDSQLGQWARQNLDYRP